MDRMELASKSTIENVTRLNSPDLMLFSDDCIYKSPCQCRPFQDEIKKRDFRKLTIATIMCVIFIIIQTVGGIISNSIAIISDALHLLTDFSTFMISLAALYFSSKPRTRLMSFGFYRIEVIGALMSILLLWLVTGALVYIAIQRILNPDFKIEPITMMYIAFFGLFSNLMMGFVLLFLKEKPESEYSDLVAINKSASINIKSAVIHVIGDLLQSAAVLIASLIIFFKPEFKIADPICTCVFSIIVFATTFHILRDVLNVLMEGFPKHLNVSVVQDVLLSIPGVLKIHNLRMWSLTLDKVALCAHIVVQEGENQSDLLKNASQIICNKLNIHEVTLQVEVDEPSTVSS